jgi:hypothetical protein
MADRVYIETTVISYLTARPSRDVVIAGHQQTTHEWWDNERQKYDLCVSQLVIKESSAGDPAYAEQRLAKLQGMTVLETPLEALDLAKDFVSAGALPAKASDDAVHVAIAAVNRVKYLITWNCRHMANATIRTKINELCKAKDFEPPIICTPEEILGTTS